MICKKIYSFMVVVLAFLALNACKPGVYYPFGGSQSGEQANAAVSGGTHSSLEAHPVVTTDIIPS